MSFVDGENLTIRGQEIARKEGIELPDNGYDKTDCFLWIPGYNTNRILGAYYPRLQEWAIRASYYTSVVGDDQTVSSVKDSLKELGFDPYVFKKVRKEAKAKGVDIPLAKDMLSHAFFGNYEAAVLVAGDGDYIPLVEEVKRHGKRVILWFFDDDTLSRDLKRVVDGFYDLTGDFVRYWRTRRNIPIPR